MPGTCEQFAQAVVTAGMLSADAMQSFWASLPAANRPTTADALAAALVKASRITPHQAKHLLASLSGPSFGPVFPAQPIGVPPPVAILPGHPAGPAPSPVVVMAPPKHENLVIKLIGGAFATIIAPLLVTLIVNRMNEQPEPPPPALMPQAATPQTAGTAPTTVTSAPAAIKPEPAPAPIVATVERPAVSTTPPYVATKTDTTKAAPPHAPAKPTRPKPIGWPLEAKKVEAAQREWAKFLKTPETVTNSLGMKLVLIPPGSFLMGNTPKRTMKVARALKQAAELERLQDELPQHRVMFHKPWLLSSTEVTIGQFEKFVAATGYVTEAEQTAAASKGGTATHAPTWREPGYPVTEKFPVTHVSWNDAVAFCNWLSTAEKLKPCYHEAGKDWTRVNASDGYRLPTEAEWEYACRAGSATEFYFGDDPERLDNNAWYAENSEHSAKPVGLKRANAFGLHDMYGNAREWCEDWYSANYYEESSPVDPRGPGNGTLRATRGGSWYSAAARARSGERAGIAPGYHSNQFGFRVGRAR